MINWKATIGLIIAMLMVSIYGYFGIEHEERLELGDCGFAIVKNKLIEVHTDCALIVKLSDFPRVEETDGEMVMYIPEGWNLEVITK